MDPRKPVIPIAVEEDEDHVLLRYDGAVRAAPKIIHSEETIGRMRAGYVCAKCWEPHDVPFPKECSVCRFPMAERQAEFFAKAYKGKEFVGPSTSLADELEALDELEVRQKLEKTGAWTPQIIVPRSL